MAGPGGGEGRSATATLSGSVDVVVDDAGVMPLSKSDSSLVDYGLPAWGRSQADDSERSSAAR